MTDPAYARIFNILALAQGGYEPMARAAINDGTSVDEFAMDRITQLNREPVTIAAGQNLPAGSVLVRNYTATTTATTGNTGNGTMTVLAVGPDAIQGSYTATCMATNTDAGIFEIRTPSTGVVGQLNVGTEFESSVLSLLIADGSTDFVVGDSFSIVVAAGEYSGYSFDVGVGTVEDLQSQHAAGVLGLAVDTTTVMAAKQQFATVRGPVVLPANFVHLANIPQPFQGAPPTVASLLSTCIDQLALLGIVVRG